MPSMEKPEPSASKRYVIAYGDLVMTKQSEFTMSENMKKLGARELLPKVWILESDEGIGKLRERLFGAILNRRGQAMLAEIGEAFETQGLEGGPGRVSRPRPPGTRRHP